MPRPITISLSPNTEPDDVRRAWYALLHPKIWSDSSWLNKARQGLANQLKVDENAVTLTSSGRQALYYLLEAYGIGPGDEVIIQAFTCIAVPAPILWAGATPIYADILADTYNLDPVDVARKITPKTKAIIVQHTFGIPGPIEELRKLANQHNLTLIEDCAHALGQTHANQPLGTFGDAAIFSFGRDKMISSIFGGAIVSRDTNLQSPITNHQSPVPRRWLIQQLLHPILMNFLIPHYFQAAFGKVYLVLFQKLGLLSKAVAAEEKIGAQPEHVEYAYSPALAYALVNQLEKLHRFTQRRREIVQKYHTAFGGSASALLRFPMQREDALAIRAKAKAQKMLLGDWYDTPLVPGDSNLAAFRYASGSCPVAEQVAKKIINLPTYPLMTDEQVEKVVNFMKQMTKPQ